MKKIVLTAAIIFAAVLFSGTQAQYRHAEFGMGFFYTSLTPHGSWIELDDGVVVWRPASVGRGWAPYMNGQWIWTNDGWYWDSYEPYGYITYHYGRWYNDDYYGWIWVPDYEWAPAWVEWRYDDDYIGWAPLPPYAEFSVGIGIHFTYDYHTPYTHWHFVKYRHFCDPFVNRYYVGPKYKYRIFHDTRYRNDYGYERDRVINRGVDVDFVRKRSGQDIRQREIERVSSPREITRNSGRNNDRVRTYIASRDELTREARNAEIQRSDKRSSLQTSRVQLGSRSASRETSRNNDRNNSRNDNRQLNKPGAEQNRDVRPNTEANKNIRPRSENPSGNIDRSRNDARPETKSAQPQREIQPRNERRTESQPKVERKTGTQPDIDRREQPQRMGRPQRQPEPSVRTENPIRQPERSVRPERRESQAPAQRERQVETRKPSTEQQAPQRNSGRSDNDRGSRSRGR